MDVFPEFEIPKETTVHKEVHMSNALYLAQPVGKLSYMWFTSNTCYLNDLTKMYKIVTAFDPILAKEKGTVLQGTYMYYESQPCFVIHNIFKYKNNSVDVGYSEKYKLMESIIEKYILLSLHDFI